MSRKFEQKLTTLNPSKTAPEGFTDAVMSLLPDELPAKKHFWSRTRSFALASTVAAVFVAAGLMIPGGSNESTQNTTIATNVSDTPTVAGTATQVQSVTTPNEDGSSSSTDGTNQTTSEQQQSQTNQQSDSQSQTILAQVSSSKPADQTSSLEAHAEMSVLVSSLEVETTAVSQSLDFEDALLDDIEPVIIGL